MSLSDQQVAHYREHGYLVIEGVIPGATLDKVRETIARFIDQSRPVPHSDAMYDLDQTHSAAQPRVRRLKDPHKQDAIFKALAECQAIVDPICQLLGGTVRFDHSKLNFKHPGASAEIHWHQDWAFYPHTNDNLLAVGVMIEDCTMESGPLRVIPGSHKGPVYDHHNGGIFSGAVSNILIADLLDDAVDLIAPAGSISIHHVRTLHASRNCTSHTTRPLLLCSYAAVDAFPIFDSYDLEEFDARILRGTPTRVPRMETLPVRLHLPKPPNIDSIFENQEARAKV